MKNITVVKRSGAREPLALEKWQTQIAKVCAGIADVSQSMIEIRTQLHFYDGITTKEIDGITLRAIVDLIDVEQNPDVGHTNYQHVAGKQRLSMLRKDVYGSYDPPHLYDIVKTNVATGLYTPELLEWYSEDDWNRMQGMIDHAKDEQYSYAAIEQLIEKYLVKNRSTGKTYETPQVRYMVAAATVFHKEEPNSARMRYIKEYYNAAGERIIFGYSEDQEIIDSATIYPGYVPRPTDQFFTFGALVQDQMPGLENFTVQMGMQFGSRLPYGPPDHSRYKDTLRMKSYFRVDLGMSYALISKKQKKQNFWNKNFSEAEISFEVFNLLGINNVLSKQWIQDVEGKYYSIPNYLTSRRYNLKFIVRL